MINKENLKNWILKNYNIVQFAVMVSLETYLHEGYSDLREEALDMEREQTP